MDENGTRIDGFDDYATNANRVSLYLPKLKKIPYTFDVSLMVLLVYPQKSEPV